MLKLRPYRQEDAGKIVSWCRDEAEFYRWTGGSLGTWPLTEEHWNGFTAKKCADSLYFPFTAFDEKGPAGFFSLLNMQEDPGDLRFCYVIVDPFRRGQGCAKEMLRLGMLFAFHLYGAKKVSLSVFENNAAALTCYRALGFRENGRVVDREFPVFSAKLLGMERADTEKDIPL